jgi:hypothetical protein
VIAAPPQASKYIPPGFTPHFRVNNPERPRASALPVVTDRESLSQSSTESEEEQTTQSGGHERHRAGLGALQVDSQRHSPLKQSKARTMNAWSVEKRSSLRKEKLECIILHTTTTLVEVPAEFVTITSIQVSRSTTTTPSTNSLDSCENEERLRYDGSAHMMNVVGVCAGSTLPQGAVKPGGTFGMTLVPQQ